MIVETLIKKYEIANIFICGNATNIEQLEELNQRETKQLADMELEKQKALLEYKTVLKS